MIIANAPPQLDRIPSRLRTGEHETLLHPDRQELFAQAFHTVANLGVEWREPARTLIIERAMARFEVAAYTPGRYARPSLRLGAELWQTLAWQQACEPGQIQQDLTHFARALVDGVNDNRFSQHAVRLWSNVFDSPGDIQGAPWTSKAASNMHASLISAFAPVDQGVDASTLGIRALLGVIAAKLWDDPPLPSVQGPRTEGGDAPLANLSADVRLLKSYAATATGIACIHYLLACRDVAEVRHRLRELLVSFEHDRAVLPANTRPMADRLRDASILVESYDALTVGSALQSPPEPPDFRLFR